MKKIILTLAVTSSMIFTSCSEDDTTVTEAVVFKEVKNLHAPQTTDYTVNPPATAGEFTKFSFKTGAVVTDDSWDLAFRGTTILVNGGVEVGGLVDEPTRSGEASLALETGTFADISIAPVAANFKQDAAGSYALASGSGSGWYTYAGAPTHAINPIAGKIIVVKTIDGNYAKMEILSYYKDQDATSDSRYYTFNYVYNPNVGDKDFQ